jgi:hypothetical protein
MTAPAEGAAPRRRSKSSHQRSTPDAASLSRVAETAGPGEALPLHLRQPAERALDLPLGDVRLHRGPEAQAFTGFAGARAAQWRNHVFIRPDLYQPDSTAGRDLLGHELVHAGQFAAFGAGHGALSSRADASEGEARALAPKVLGGEPGTARPTAAPAAAVNRDENFTSSLPPQICDPDTWTPESNATSSSQADGGSSVAPQFRAPLPPPAREAATLTNAELIAQELDADQQIASFRVSSSETEHWTTYKTNLAAERRRRIQRGFVFLAEARDKTPAALYCMRPANRPRSFEIITADMTLALGPGEVTMTGPIMTWRQIDAYINTLGYERMTGDVMTVLADGGIMPVLGNQFGPDAGGAMPPPAFNSDDQFNRPSSLQIGPAGRYSVLDQRLGGPQSSLLDFARTRPAGQLPTDIATPVMRSGTISEIGVGADPRLGWGMGHLDTNTQKWLDINGVLHEPPQRNFPLVDYAARAPQVLAVNPISVTSSTRATYADRRTQYRRKLDLLLDLDTRRSPPDPNIVRDYLRTTTGQAGLAPGSAQFTAAQNRYLGDTYFAVPKANLEPLQRDLRNPLDKPVFGGGDRKQSTLANPNYRALYEHLLQSGQFDIRNPDGTVAIQIRSLRDLATHAHNASAMPEFTRRNPVPPGSPEGTRGRLEPMSGKKMSKIQFDALMVDLGNTAASRIIPAEHAARFAQSADVARGVGTTTAPSTRVLEIGSTNFNYVGSRIAEGLGDARTPDSPGSLHWTTGTEGNALLTALRNLSGDHTLTETSPNYADLRRRYLGQAQLAINADDVAAFRQELRSANVDAKGANQAWSGRMRERMGAALQDSPIRLQGNNGVVIISTPDALDAALSSGQITPDQYSAAQTHVQEHLANRILQTNVTTEGLNRLSGLMDTARPLDAEGRASLVTPAEVANARLGHTQARNRSMAGGAGMGLVFSVLTTSGVMLWRGQDPSEHLGEITSSGGRDFLVGGAQSGLEHSAETYFASRAMAAGRPGLGNMGKFGIRASSSGGFAVVAEGLSMVTDGRENSTLEVVTRTGRAAGIAIVSAEIGAAAGSVVPVAGTIVGAIVGLGVGLALDYAIGGGKDYWDEQAAEIEEAARRQREHEEWLARQPKVVGELGMERTLNPVMSSPDITEEEQATIARWLVQMSYQQQLMSGMGVYAQ